MIDKKMSYHFLLSEMTRTENRKFLEANRVVPEDLYQNGVALCNKLLEPIRIHFGRPLIVHSAYRGIALNKAIGGSKTSQHCKFEACDFHIVGVPLKEIFDWIRKDSGLRFSQVIMEMGSWIHIALPTLKVNMQVLNWNGKQYTKIPHQANV
ncbi:MAG: D-Ala-D-Ala carboxypeptidase family metallohydrolase [Pedobacter sp.]|uniref:D-Ala-D-Ala carboxypeptidase family metallohydrolase n=1 Tax=Pedobacter sp. TaxID=1411316 RepID=UPI0035617E4B